jgi:integrase/recombinase XerD
MPAKLITTVNKIALIPNSVNSSLAREFHQHLIINGASERHQNNCLKAVIAFSNHLGPGMSFYNIQGREQITSFLDTKRKSIEQDPDKKWITTWNHYLIHIKLFLRWLYNCKGKAEDRISPTS